ncbi:hypothetical protein NPIL_474301 [Nephila pilipes]|uniref:Uncharacterized protein n=1 Tax=Nephila pilipes TaxID=299642 RepID=A0A8X6Q961_NEPPI|nr:hypothetical protein NPIL_474301 [Nephila pilipes]
MFGISSREFENQRQINFSLNPEIPEVDNEDVTSYLFNLTELYTNVQKIDESHQRDAVLYYKLINRMKLANLLELQTLKTAALSVVRHHSNEVGQSLEHFNRTLVINSGTPKRDTQQAINAESTVSAV